MGVLGLEYFGVHISILGSPHLRKLQNRTCAGCRNRCRGNPSDSAEMNSRGDGTCNSRSHTKSSDMYSFRANLKTLACRSL